MKVVKNTIAICLLLIAATGCKKENTDDKAKAAKETSEDASVQIVLDIVVKKDDVFQLFYSDDGTLNFTQEKSVGMDIKGKNESQLVVFDLPGQKTITNLRLDVGQNEAQEEMTINKFIIKMYDKEMEIIGADFFNYFSPAGYVKTNPAQSSFVGTKVNGVYDPFFFGNNNLAMTLKKFDQ